MESETKAPHTRLFSRIVLGATALLLSTLGCKKPPEINWEHRYQDHADRVRVKQLNDLAALIERFHRAKGYYPLTHGAIGPVDVAISRQPLQGIPSNAVPAQLEQELSTALGETISLPRDPQMHDQVDVGTRVYHYHADANTYAVYAHLYFPSPVTEPVNEAKHEHRFTLTKNQGPTVKVPAWTNDDRELVKAGNDERAKL